MGSQGAQRLVWLWRGEAEVAAAALADLWFIHSVAQAGPDRIGAAVSHGIPPAVAALYLSDALGGCAFDCPATLGSQHQPWGAAPMLIVAAMAEDVPGALLSLPGVLGCAPLPPQGCGLYCVGLAEEAAARAGETAQRVAHAVALSGGVAIPPRHRVLSFAPTDGPLKDLGPAALPLAAGSASRRLLLPPPPAELPGAAALSGLAPLEQAAQLPLPLAKARLLGEACPAAAAAAPAAGAATRLVLRLHTPGVHCKSCTAKIAKALVKAGYANRDDFVCDVSDREVLVLLPAATDLAAAQVARDAVAEVLAGVGFPVEPRRLRRPVLHLAVTGMTCKSCEARIRRMFRPRPTAVTWTEGACAITLQGGEDPQQEAAAAVELLGQTGKFSARLLRVGEDDSPAPEITAVSVAACDERAESSLLLPAARPEAGAPTPAAALPAELPPLSAEPQWLETALLVKDMTCASCAARIEDHMGDHPLVSRCVVNFSTCTAKVRHSGELNPAQVAADITGLGYRATVFKDGGAERSADFRKSLTREDDIADAWNAARYALLLAVPLVVVFMVLSRIHSFHEKVLMVRVIRGVTVAPILQLLVATPVVAIWGRPFFTRAQSALAHRTFTMDVLVALGVSAAFFASLISLFEALCDDSPERHHDYQFHTAAMLISFMLLGKYLEARAKSRTAQALLTLLDLQPTRATVLDEDGTARDVDVDDVMRGDRLRLVTGAKVPVDATVLSGSVSVDESMLTGEPVPRTRVAGESVAGGTLCVDGAATLRASADAGDSTPAQIFRLVNNAQMSKAPIQKYADRAAAVFVPCVVSFSVVVFVVWLCLGLAGAYPDHWRKDADRDVGVFMFSAKFLITTLVTACPCAMGLATPTAVMVGTGVGARHAVFIKGGEALETASAPHKCVLFDKTGTLTAGQLTVSEESAWAAPGGRSRAQALRLVAATEQMSQHPIARAIVSYGEAAQEGGGALPDAKGVTTTPGKGIRAVVEGAAVVVGSPLWVLEQLHGTELAADSERTAREAARRLGARGLTLVMAAIDSVPVFCFGLEDSVKPEARAVVTHLTTKQDCDVFMVTGDAENAARHVAAKCGIPPANVFFSVLPGDKASIVRRLQRLPPAQAGKGRRYSAASVSDRPSSVELVSARFDCPETPEDLLSPMGSDSDGLLQGQDAGNRRCVVFVGDGINDAPALATADVGVAIGAGTSVAVDAADAVLARSDLRDVVTFIDLSEATMRRIRANFVWAFGYNVLALPIAAGFFLPIFGVQIPPVFGGMAMVASSLCVLASSLALRRYSPPALRPVRATL
eukprot:TRINITY_DN1338_c4_g1_i1.p1 TRINITY_DN1338_c4_g1~~TRINITY_DN1338_c4_g1_i1.p1  ORF type:complete len:1325 (+),score=351.03 TRINITY_DN1338_c4_g1_i1:63-3977(+)